MKVIKAFSIIICTFVLIFCAIPVCAADSGLDGPDPSKPAETKDIPNITVELTSSTYMQWLGEEVILTATASQDVGPTPYYISIYDYTNKIYLVTCSIGTTCSTDDMIHSPVPYTPISNAYVAYVGSYPVYLHKPPPTVISSDTINVTWHGGSVKLNANKNTTSIGGAVQLTATTTLPMEQSPSLVTMIFDATTQTRLAMCNSGTQCVVTVSQGAAVTHKYIAYTGLSTTVMPPMIQASVSSPVFVAWANTGWSIVLSAKYVGNHQATLTATTNKDVMASPYYISIFNATTNQRIAMCMLGTTCATTITYEDGTDYVAFVSSFPNPENICPPQNVQANSKTYRLN